MPGTQATSVTEPPRHTKWWWQASAAPYTARPAPTGVPGVGDDDVQLWQRARVRQEPATDGPSRVADALGVTQPLVSQHLRVLRADHLVVGRRRGREVAYSLGDDHIAHIVGDAVVHAGERSHARP